METTTVVKDIALKFRTPTIHDIDSLKKYFEGSTSRSCDYSIVGVLLWQEYFHYRIAEVNDTLFVMGVIPDSETPLFYAPQGKMENHEAVLLIKEYLQSQNKSGLLIKYEECESEIQFIESDSNSCLQRDWMEYLYDIHKFETFAGKKMEKKRNHLNYFYNHYSGFEVEEISEKNVEDIIEFTEIFATSHKDVELALYESRHTLSILSNYKKYNQVGIAIRYEGVIIGFSFGEIVGDTLLAHVEKGNVEYRGIYQMLASQLCKTALSKNPDLKYVNREDDMGSEHLRQSKMSYHPDLFINKSLTRI